jgi:hypothetical protein
MSLARQQFSSKPDILILKIVFLKASLRQAFKKTILGFPSLVAREIPKLFSSQELPTLLSVLCLAACPLKSY